MNSDIPMTLTGALMPCHVLVVSVSWLGQPFRVCFSRISAIRKMGQVMPFEVTHSSIVYAHHCCQGLESIDLKSTCR